jgi:hypothetical protein
VQLPNMHAHSTISIGKQKGAEEGELQRCPRKGMRSHYLSGMVLLFKGLGSVVGKQWLGCFLFPTAERAETLQAR